MPTLHIVPVHSHMTVKMVWWMFRGKLKSVYIKLKKAETNECTSKISQVLNPFEKFIQDIFNASANPSQNDDEDIEVEAVTCDVKRSESVHKKR